jgi:hypothetical protein
MTHMATLSLAWVEAVVARLNSDATLNTLITGVYVHPPEDITPPYLLLTPPRLQQRSSRGLLVVQGEALFTLWSSAPAVALAHSIMERTEQVLTNSALNVTPHHLVIMRMRDMQIHRMQQRELAASVLQVNLWMEGV